MFTLTTQNKNYGLRGQYHSSEVWEYQKIPTIIYYHLRSVQHYLLLDQKKHVYFIHKIQNNKYFLQACIPDIVYIQGVH